MKNTTQYTTLLEAEKVKLEQELGTLGTRDTTNPSNWDLKPSTLDVLESDDNEFADRVEEAHIDTIVMEELEMRYRLVQHALDKVRTDNYGLCEVCSMEIEDDRLQVNPASRTCKTHVNEEDSLIL
jgi:RNA polymerase-binding transcription factor DksA